MKVGDIVLIHDDGPKLHWRLGVIDSLRNDGLCRAMNVRTSNRVTSRPISRLYPLEVSLPPDDQSEHSSPTEPITRNIEDMARNRPQRAAAKKARTRGVASQKVMEGQACPHETLKIIHDCKKG